MKYGIFALTLRGSFLGEVLKGVLKGSELYLLERLRGRETKASSYLFPQGGEDKGGWQSGGVKFFRNLKDEVFNAFFRYNGLIFIMATGIVVRTIAPLLKGKDKDPAVIVIDEKGRYVISLLSGHLGGANELARRIARLIDAEPVITTATDVNGLPCIEGVASTLDCIIEDIDKIKLVNSAIVNGGRICFIDEDAKRLEWVRGFLEVQEKEIKEDAFIFATKVDMQAKEVKADATIFITEKVLTGFPENTIFLRPRRLVVGIGCNRGVRPEEIERAYLEVLKRWGISPLAIKRLATIDIKRGEEGLLDFAKRYNLEIDFFSKDELLGVRPPSGISPRVMERVGVGGVCEPAAMLSAGVEEIWIKKERLGRVTIAIAREPFIL